MSICEVSCLWNHRSESLQICLVGYVKNFCLELSFSLWFTTFFIEKVWAYVALSPPLYSPSTQVTIFHSWRLCDCSRQLSTACSLQFTSLPTPPLLFSRSLSAGLCATAALIKHRRAVLWLRGVAGHKSPEPADDNVLTNAPGPCHACFMGHNVQLQHIHRCSQVLRRTRG